MDLEKNKYSYQMLKKRYMQQQLKVQALRVELRRLEKDMKYKDTRIKNLKAELEERSKLIKEKNLIIGGLLKKIGELNDSN